MTNIINKPGTKHIAIDTCSDVQIFSLACQHGNIFCPAEAAPHGNGWMGMLSLLLTVSSVETIVQCD